MKNISGNFSLRESLQIIIPGIYLVGLLRPIIESLNIINNASDSDSIELIVSGTFSLIIGMMIYAFDLPKRLWFFKSNHPTTKISKNLNHIKNAHNAYFEFYDNKISDKQKDITEKYTSIYHFSINMALASVLVVAGCLFQSFGNFFNSNGFIALIILILCIILTSQIFYGNRKINYIFQRQYDKFKKEIESKN